MTSIGRLILVLLLGTLSAWAQDPLPTCQGTDVSKWHGCRGVVDEAEFSYAGDFRRGKFEGRGILEFTGEKYQGDHYQGEFKSGLKHGFGIYFFASGEKYAGHYVNGMRHGFGTYTFINGKAPLSGVWANNQWTGQTAPASEERAEQKKNSKPLTTEVARNASDVVALVIGVESYQSVNKALYANTDAKQFHNLMRNTVGVGAENIKTLSNEKASRSEILSAFKFWLPSHVQKGKTHVYVFFSGHGLRSDEDAQKYWLPTDANKGLLGETAIAERWVMAELQKLNAKSVTVFLDTCDSGMTRRGEPLDVYSRGVQLKPSPASVSTVSGNLTVFSAAAANQAALSADEFKQGIFSYFLIKGLSGDADTDGNQRISSGELIDYLSAKVDKKAMSLNRRQQPQLVGDRQRNVLP
jgi:hypothetical protein